MTQPLTYLPETASQTAGPYVHIGLAPSRPASTSSRTTSATSCRPGHQGRAHHARGPRLRRPRRADADVLMEIWQANAAGLYPHPDRRPLPKPSSPPSAAGAASLRLRHRSLPFRRQARRGRPRPPAPHVASGSSRAASTSTWTRGCTSSTRAANATDPVLNGHRVGAVSPPQTLVAQRSLRDGKPVYTFDIRVQGEGETVFFDV